MAVFLPRTSECLTSDVFSSCLMNDQDSRQAKLRFLLTDLAPGQSRAYGCNVTSVHHGRQARINTWVLIVEISSKLFVYMPFYFYLFVMAIANKFECFCLIIPVYFQKLVFSPCEWS